MNNNEVSSNTTTDSAPSDDLQITVLPEVKLACAPRINNLNEYFTDDELKEVVKTVKSVTAILRHFRIPRSGGYSNAVKTHIKDLGLNVPIHKNERKIAPRNKTCPVCEKAFITYGKLGGKSDKTCCSVGCSNTYFKEIRYTPESNKKRIAKIVTGINKFGTESYMDGLKIYNKVLTRLNAGHITKEVAELEIGVVLFSKLITRVCSHCERVFYLPYKSRTIRYCTPNCSKTSPEVRAKQAATMKEKVARGEHSGWKSRGKHLRSYPEIFFDNWLTYNKFSFEPEVSFDKYFIDTLITLPSCRIAFEIDGKQHWKSKDRRTSDLIKQNLLLVAGYHVLRVPWVGSATKNYLPLIKASIQTLALQEVPTLVSIAEDRYPALEDDYCI